VREEEVGVVVWIGIVDVAVAVAGGSGVNNYVEYMLLNPYLSACALFYSHLPRVDLNNLSLNKSHIFTSSGGITMSHYELGVLIPSQRLQIFHFINSQASQCYLSPDES